MNKDQVFFQREEDSVITDAQAVLAHLTGQFFHVAAQVVLERIEPLADPPAQFLGQNAQLRQGLIADPKTLVHPPIMPGSDAWENCSNT